MFNNNETEDPDENVEHVDNQVDYYHADRDVKCKLLALTLIGSSLTSTSPFMMEALIHGLTCVSSSPLISPPKKTTNHHVCSKWNYAM